MRTVTAAIIFASSRRLLRCSLQAQCAVSFKCTVADASNLQARNAADAMFFVSLLWLMRVVCKRTVTAAMQLIRCTLQAQYG